MYACFVSVVIYLLLQQEVHISTCVYKKQLYKHSYFK